MTPADEVILLDDDGLAIGTAPRSSVHGTDTPLHLAFSCHVVRADGRVLVTRRALDKRAWPGVWSNAFCGHPLPGEDPLAAVHRRAGFELGIGLSRLELALPRFRYRAVDASGIVENELCPVYTAFTDDEPDVNPNEVVDFRWVEPSALAAALRATPWAFSPWLVLQAEQLPLFDAAR